MVPSRIPVDSMKEAEHSSALLMPVTPKSVLTNSPNAVRTWESEERSDEQKFVSDI